MRKALSKKTRFEVFKRDAFACQYCGAHPPQVVLHVDHIVAVAEGGGNEMDNLATSCEPCNLGKSARSLSVVPQSLRDKASDVAEREEQLRGYQEILLAKRDRLEEEAWNVANALDPEADKNGFRKDWLISIKKFLERLGLHEVLDAADLAAARIYYFGPARFRYFCGICWSKIKEGGAVRYLKVKNWTEFQHYKDRNPPWIKLHRALLDDYEFARLQDASKAHLMLIWLFASQKDGLIPDDPSFLKKKLGLEKEPNLKLLISHGLLIPEQNASNELAACEQSATREESYKSSEKTTEEVFVLPDWIPQDAWKAYLHVRKEKKIPNTPRALKMLVSELDRLKSLGYSPEAVIDQSMLKGWKSFYALKAEVVALQVEPKAQLCDYCTKLSTGTVNGRRACAEHWQLAMDNERPAKVAA